MTLTRKIVIAAVTVLVAAAFAIGLYLHTGGTAPLIGSTPRLTFPNNGPFGISLPYRNDKPWALGGIALCLNKPGTVTITGLVPQGGEGGLKLVQVATRHHAGHNLFGASQRTLQAEGFPTGTPIVNQTCDDPANPHYYELASSWVRTVAGNGRFTSVRLDYTVEGKAAHLIIPWTLKLCGPNKHPHGNCGDPDVP
jgi:hypothetical protein